MPPTAGSALGALGQPWRLWVSHPWDPARWEECSPWPSGGALPSCSAQPVPQGVFVGDGSHWLALVLKPPGMIICRVRSESHLQASSFYSWEFTPPAPSSPCPPARPHATCHLPLPIRLPTPPFPVNSAPLFQPHLREGTAGHPPQHNSPFDSWKRLLHHLTKSSFSLFSNSQFCKPRSTVTALCRIPPTPRHPCTQFADSLVGRLYLLVSHYGNERSDLAEAFLSAF